MNERAKQIAAWILRDVYNSPLAGSFTEKMEAAVEKHMLRPHQIKDRDGCTWEQMSDGTFRTLNGRSADCIDRNIGPLTEVQGEPTPAAPDDGEIARLKERIAELENDLKATFAFDTLRRAALDARDRQIDELKKQLATAKVEPAKPQPEAIWQQISDGEWVFGVPVRGIIWQPIAKVIDGCDFFWHLIDLSQKGHHQHFRDAIDAATVAAEKAIRAKS